MKLCYFGIYDPEFGRNKVYMSGVRQLGHEIIECRDTSRGPLKFWRLWRKHCAVLRAGGYDVLIVGYPGHLVVPLARMIVARGRPVVFDALCTLYEGEIISRGRYRWNPLMRGWIYLVDWLAAKSAHLILVETNAQKDFFVKRFSLPPAKVVRVYTGVDPELFRSDLGVKKRGGFTVVFRGKFLPEAGLPIIIRAAKALEHQGVQFLLLGHGFMEGEVKALIEKTSPANLEWVGDRPPLAELARREAECHVALGQFDRNERVDRTIPHKAFEALALGLPYVTGRAAGVSELFTDGKDCLMVARGDAEDLAAKLLRLKNEPALARELGANARALYEEKLTPERLAGDIVSAILSL